MMRYSAITYISSSSGSSPFVIFQISPRHSVKTVTPEHYNVFNEMQANSVQFTQCTFPKNVTEFTKNFSQSTPTSPRHENNIFTKLHCKSHLRCQPQCFQSENMLVTMCDSWEKIISTSAWSLQEPDADLFTRTIGGGKRRGRGRGCC